MKMARLGLPCCRRMLDSSVRLGVDSDEDDYIITMHAFHLLRQILVDPNTDRRVATRCHLRAHIYSWQRKQDLSKIEVIACIATEGKL